MTVNKMRKDLVLKTIAIVFLAGALVIQGAAMYACCKGDKYHERNRTLGEMFDAIADDEDEIANEWERRLVGDGWSGFAGWDCGRQSDGAYRGYAMVMIKTHRDAARKIREERLHNCTWQDLEQRQADWQKWYDDYHKRHPEAKRPAAP